MSDEAKKGIEQTKDVVILLTKIGLSIAECVIEKEFQINLFMDDMMALPGAITNISEVPTELKDIDSEEAKVLIEAVLEQLKDIGIVNTEAAKKFISAGINFLEGTFDIINGIKELKH